MFELNPVAVPFSRYGAWFCVSWVPAARAPDGAAGYYLKALHGGVTNVLRLTPMRNGQPVAVEATQTPAVLSVRDEQGGSIDFAFGNARTLRIRGTGGLGLRFQTTNWWAEMYSQGKNLTAFIISTVRRYQVELVRGQLVREGLWQARPHDARPPIHLDLLPGSDGTWDAALDEFWSTWLPQQRPSFDDVVAEANREIDAWTRTMPRAPTGFEESRKLAAWLNWSCVVSPEGFLRRPAMFMSKNWMTNIWSWDNCFNAMALAKGQPELAWDQVMAIADLQDEFGAYPDFMSDSVRTFNYCKPPVHGWTVQQLLARSPSLATAERLGTIYASLERWTDWWLRHRRLEGHALPYYLHGNDSGWDNSTMFDSGVPLEAPDLSAFLVIQMDSLADLAGRLGCPKEAQAWTERANQLQAALLTELWRSDRFIARVGTTGEEIDSRSLIPCIPILLGRRLPAEVRGTLIHRIKGFLTEWGVATEETGSPRYEPDGYWRGPIWAPSTYIVVCGLERCGETALALDIAERYCRLCRKSGFAENFDAITGAALRDPAYSWTSSVFLLLAERLVEARRTVD